MTTYRAQLSGEGIVATNDLEREQRSMRVRVWDCGPKKPAPPSRPQSPHGKSGDPEYELAKVEFQEQIEDYQKAIKEYGRLKQEHADWHARYGGPYELLMWSMDAREALQRDPERYFESHPNLANGGLPEGKKPGRAHQENMARARTGAAELETERQRDPQFGNQGVAA